MPLACAACHAQSAANLTKWMSPIRLQAALAHSLLYCAVATDAEPNSTLAKEAAEAGASLADAAPSERPQRKQRKVRPSCREPSSMWAL